MFYINNNKKNKKKKHAITLHLLKDSGVPVSFIHLKRTIDSFLVHVMCPKICLCDTKL